jgi:hypothetical protein
MQQSVQDLAAMKAGGSTIDQREARLAEGVSQLQQFLCLFGSGETAPAGPPPQPVSHLPCVWPLVIDGPGAPGGPAAPGRPPPGCRLLDIDFIFIHARQ